MGNCIHTCLPRLQAQEEHHDDKELKQPRREVDEESEGDHVGVRSEKRLTKEYSDGQGKVNNKELSEAGKGDGGGVMRLKIVLTKEELQWLMMQLNSDKEKRLENMLEEIQRGRKKVVCEGGSGNNGWKPSLESIIETPECLEMDTSIRL
ncbi:unnamed protein product [Rhodiola kirilowii]